MLPPIESVSVVDAIERRLKEMITNGSVQPGEKLPSERELQARLGVSRLPLREALARLEALGLIRVRHGKGAFVEDRVSRAALSDVLITYFPNQSEDRLRDLVEARGLLESEISALATAKATPEDLQALEAILQSDDEAITDPELFASKDYAFHHQLAEIAANGFLLLMHEALGPHIRSFILAYAHTEADRQGALQRNRELFEAIKSGDPKEAARMARVHLQPCLKAITRAVGTAEEG